MVKFRYLLIWAVVGFFSMAVLSFVMENYILKLEAMQVRSYTETAADCALQTGQGIDDFFAEPVVNTTITNINNDTNRNTHGIVIGSWYKNSNVKGLRIKYDDGHDNYSESDLLRWYINESHTNSNSLAQNVYGYNIEAGKSMYDRYKAFSYLYNVDSGSETSQEFYNFATSAACINSTTQLPYAIPVTATSDPLRGQIIWIKVPRIALIGAKCLWNNESEFKVTMQSVGNTTIYGEDGLSDLNVHRMWKAITTNKYYDIIKGKGDTSALASVFGSYVLTPSKVGVSYIPRELIEKLYQNNLDLLLRARYQGEIQDYSGLVNDTWAYQDDSIDIHKSNAEAFNDIVNNGMIAISKETSTITNIEYKCIDVFNDSNNALIGAVYGGVYVYAGHFSTSDGIFKAAASKLKMLRPNTLMKKSGDFWTPTKSDSKYEVVAKITFSTDVILSHKTAVFTNWGTKYDKSNKNVNDIEIKNGIDTNTATRNKKYIYTRFYDINA